VQNVGGERVVVESVIPDAADPHTYEATPQDLVRLSESDVFIFMGAYLEPFMESGAWRRAMENAEVPILELGAQMELIEVDRIVDHGDHVHDFRGGDPHVWLNPLKVVEMVDLIEVFLIELDHASADRFAAQAEEYRARLIELDADIEQRLSDIPPERRNLVVFHDAFTYFAERYDFDVVGVVLRNPEGEPSAREIVQLKQIIEERNITVLFTEPQFPTDIVVALANETGTAVAELLTDTFAGLVGSYIELMEFNVSVLEEHLS
jgi:ABC-type Zn uptake system ZnuABC Zn-binding protein ZnuA